MRRVNKNSSKLRQTLFQLCPIVMEWKSETIITKYVFFALFVFVYSIFVWQSNLRLVKTNEDKGVSSSVLISPCVGFHAWLSIGKRCRLVLSACPFATKSDMAAWPKTFASAEMAMIACDSHSQLQWVASTSTHLLLEQCFFLSDTSHE